MIANAKLAPRFATVAVALIASAALLIGCPPAAPANSGPAGAGNGGVNTAGGNTDTNTGGGTGGNEGAEPDPLADIEGGEPLPEGTHGVVFAVMGKQSISFLSDASERIAGNVEFPADGGWQGEGDPEHVGTATFEVGADVGSGNASFSIPVHSLRTGNTVRDEHLQSADWMDAAQFPLITFEVGSVERVRPTVWKVVGEWSMHGETQLLTIHANVRFIETFPRLDGSYVRVSAAFDLALKDFGIANQAVGTPAVAEVWQVELALLGQIQE